MSFEVHILGSSAASPAHGRHHSSQILKIQDVQIMVDCGEGAQSQMKKYDLKKGRINHIFISHLHGDHYLGLMGLISTMHLNGRKQALNIYGPVGLSDIITLQLKYSNTRLKYTVHFHELSGCEAEIIVDHPKFTVKKIPLRHRIPCFGFVFKEKKKPHKLIKHKIEGLKPSLVVINQLKKGQDYYDESGDLVYEAEEFTLPPKKSRSYAYCSDTVFDESIISYVQKVDLLYHEATFMEDMKERAKDTFHSTAKQAALIAKQANAERLILGHFSNRYIDLEPVLQEAKEVFEASYLGEEGTVFNISE